MQVKILITDPLSEKGLDILRNHNFDVIYKPNETNFLKVGKKLGSRTENGKSMFIYQALASFKKWHGIQPEINREVIKILD